MTEMETILIRLEALRDLSAELAEAAEKQFGEDPYCRWKERQVAYENAIKIVRGEKL